MANKLSVEASVEFRPENRKAVSTGELMFTYEPASKAYITGIQTIGTTEEVLELGDVSTAGMIIIINRDTTNFVEVGLTASYPIKLLPGQFCMVPPSSGAIYALANTAEVDVEFYVFPEKTSEV